MQPQPKPQEIFQKRGVWVEKPRKSAILICACGNKYIKTRKEQSICIQCINRAASLARVRGGQLK